MNEMFELFHDIGWKYMGDMKALSSFITATTCGIASVFLLYDLFIGRRIPKMWRWTLLLMAMMKASIGVFALTRFFDALYDAQYIINHPDVESTLSQNIPILEIPMLGVGITALLFILVYSHVYYQLPRPNSPWKRRVTD